MVDEAQYQPSKFSLVKGRAYFIWIVTLTFVASVYGFLPTFIEEFLGGPGDEEEGIWSSRRTLSLVATHLILMFILVPSLLLADIVMVCLMVIYTLVFEIV